MMNYLRESAHGIFAKIFLGLLVLSFGIWGIGDIFRQGTKVSDVATVGGTGISVQQYQQALREQQESLRQRLGTKYSPDLIRKYSIDKMVRNQLIVNLLIEEEAKSLGVAVGDDNVIDVIRATPGFKGENGQFDTALYLDTLKNKGVSESRYVNDMRKDMAAKLLDTVLASGVVVPEELVEALYKSREEQRVAGLLILPLSAVKQVPVPTDKDIKAFYDAHNKEFSAPEYRTASYVMLKEADVQSEANVPEEDIKRAYDEHIQDYHKSEQRTVEQILFDNEGDAKIAANKLKHGASFTDIAKEASVINKGKTLLGTITKQETPAEIADQVFALKENEVSEPIHSEFGWHILRVTKVEPESVQPLAAVHASIAKELAGKGTQDILYKLVNTLEDALAGGVTLEEAAAKIGQKVQTFGPVTQDGTSPDGKKLAPPHLDNFMNTVFATNEKDHSQAVQTNDNSYFLVRTDEIQPEHVRPLAEVKNQIVAAWSEEKKRALLHSLSDTISAELRAGQKPEAVLASHNISLQPVSSGKLKRGSSATSTKQVLPDSLVRELFSLKPLASTHAYTLPNGECIIASLTQVIPVPDVAGNSSALAAIRSELKDTMTKETINDYLSYLSSKYHVSKNDAALGIKDEQSGE